MSEGQNAVDIKDTLLCEVERYKLIAVFISLKL